MFCFGVLQPTRLRSPAAVPGGTHAWRRIHREWHSACWLYCFGLLDWSTDWLSNWSKIDWPTSSWLNQPLWTNMFRQNGNHFPKLGVKKIRKSLSWPPPSTTRVNGFLPTNLGHVFTFIILRFCVLYLVLHQSDLILALDPRLNPSP